MTNPVCKLCGRGTRVFCRPLVLGRHLATYDRCATCGFVQARDPDWLAEAYITPINPMDTGCVDRTWHFARATAAVISGGLRVRGPFLDFGGGYGLFVRFMRDGGFDFRWMDGYCRNLLAAGFEADPARDGRYGLVTSFEVFEHLTDPRPQFEQLLQWSDALLFSTELVPQGMSTLEGWHFAGFEHGQHVSFFSRESLQRVADGLGVRFVSNGRSLHLFTRRSVSLAWFRLLTSHKASAVLRPLWRRPSLILADRQHMETVLRERHGEKNRTPDGPV
jgi:Methyltransferase domain